MHRMQCALQCSLCTRSSMPRSMIDRVSRVAQRSRLRVILRRLSRHHVHRQSSVGLTCGSQTRAPFCETYPVRFRGWVPAHCTFYPASTQFLFSVYSLTAVPLDGNMEGSAVAVDGTCRAWR